MVPDNQCALRCVVEGMDDFDLTTPGSHAVPGAPATTRTTKATETDTVKNSLNKARTNNLPRDKAGIIFVKVPQVWLEQEDVRRGIRAVAEGFLRNTKRIVSVVVYATVMRELGEQRMMLMRHRFEEFPNACHRFDMTKSWALFKDYKVPEEWGGMHPKWVRVFSQGFIMRDK